MDIATAPVICALIPPVALMDLSVGACQAICVPVCGIARVRRGDHIVIDRRHLADLNGLQNLACIYCGNGNGLISHVREIAGRTEQDGCPIKHARRTVGAQDHYADVADYGDAEAYRKDSGPLRARLRPGDA